MNSMKNNRHIHKLLLFLALVPMACKDGDEYHSLTEKMDALETPYHGKLSSEELLAGTELISIKEGEHTFLIPERKGQIKSYACIECHTKPVSQMKGDGVQKAHWDIKMAHASKEIMDCATCHNPEDMNHIQTLTGRPVDFNLSHKVCLQCHDTQYEDWKGGAHGKKVAGWAPPRASMTCVNCHNPHDPGFEKKLPVIFNTKKAAQRQEGLDH
ncbi:multiheme c-type cytochrome [Maribacter sp. 2307ULW6-5]|uniref:multiheme c-type cytochrome n=1 Tax=Maribacter sp. 2307ULW6-5 TaxID=3386275 RepID=UPI0039BC9F2A